MTVRGTGSVLVLALATWAATATAGDKAKGNDWSSFGGPITVKKAQPIAKLQRATPAKSGEVLTTATIAEVCQAKGCWMSVEDGKTAMRVEFKDYGFFVPYASEGRKVRLQGVVTERELSEEEREHYASESKSGVKLPAKTLVFVASAVAIEGEIGITDAQKARIEGKKPDAKHEDGHKNEDGHKH